MSIVNRSEKDVIVDSSLPPESLSSKQFATIVDVLSEGEIEGFPSASSFTKGTANYNKAALKDVFLGKTPVLRATANPTNTQATDFNFQNVEFEPRFGTSNQTFIPGIKNIETERNVNVKVVQDTPVSRQVTNSLVNALRVTIQFNSLQKFEDNGDVNGTEVRLRILIIDNTNNIKIPIDETVKGRTSSTYNRDYRVDLSSSLVFPLTVRVERVTDDAEDPNRLRNEFLFKSFTEIIDEQRPYPDIAHAALRFDSEQFSSVPNRMFRVRGVKIKIPHNGTVDPTTGRIIYTGIFNGTLTTTTHWTSDPAWVLFDLLTNSRYGLGDHITEAQLDKFAFYSASVYSSELVDDGLGGKEPRFSCNTILQKREDAYTTVNALSSIMRTMPFWSAGSLTISQDRPTDPSYLFNLSNVTEEGFTYSGTSLKTRSTVVSVSYFDMDNQELDFETVEDSTARAKYGVIHKKVTGFGCTSRGQASRLAKFILFEEQNSTETINFITSLSEGVIVRPGQVIEVSDPVRAGVRRGGRIKSATVTSVTVDDVGSTDLDTSNNPKLSVILSDGSVETKDVSSINGAVITVNGAFSSAPNSNSVWILQNSTLETTQWRVISVNEDQNNYAITGIAYNPGKFDFVEDGTPLPPRNVTLLTSIKDSPSNLDAFEQFYIENEQAKVKIILDWEAVPGVNQYRLQYRKDNGNFTSITVNRTDFEIFDTSEGLYEFRVFSINAALETSSTPATKILNAVGKSAIPSDPTNITVEPISEDFVRLKFTPSTDIDVVHGGTVVIRHTPEVGQTGTFSNSVDIQVLPGNSSEAVVAALTGKYSLKYRDDGGRFSKNAAQIIVTEPDFLANQVIFTEREDTDSPPFQGVKVNTIYDSTLDALVLEKGGDFDSVPNLNLLLTNIDDLGEVLSRGSYEFKDKLDLGAIFTLTLKRLFLTSGIYSNSLFDSRTAFIDTWDDFDGLAADNVNARLLVATTDEDPAASISATYSQSTTTITITKTNHGLSVGDFVVIDFTSGTGADGNYEIQTVPNVNTFTVTSNSSATTNGNCTFGSPFTKFNEFSNGQYKGRGFKFRTELESNDPAQNISISQLGYEASLKQRTETVNTNINSLCATNNAAKTVTFSAPFFTGSTAVNGSANAFLPTIGITLEGAVSGDYFKITSITSTQFTIETRDVNNNFKDMNFKYTAIGFGKGN